MEKPERLIAAFAGSGVLSATPVLRVLEALELRGVTYHKGIPAIVERARSRLVEDRGDRVGRGPLTTRTLQLEWECFHEEPRLSTEGLEGFRTRLPEFPMPLLGVRIRLGYSFPGLEEEAVDLTFLQLGGERYEVQLATDAGRILDATEAKRSRANALMVADLAEALYDVLDPPFGTMRIDAGVLPDEIPVEGWGYYCGALVDRVGRSLVEAFSGRCYKSWELADGGWFLAPAPFGEREGELGEARAGLLAPLRHLTLEAIRGRSWSPN